MNFSKQTTCIVFVLLILLNIILRYPVVPHEIGWDSFVVHSVVNSLSESGFAKWWLHPTSVIGSYPFSIGGAVPFLLSAISQLSGFNVDLSILLYSIIIGLICIFISYIMAGSFFDDSRFKFLVAFGFSTCSAILTFTSWTASTRTLFTVVLLPLILYLLLKTRQSFKYYLLLGFIFVLGLSTHHYVYFTIPIIFSAFFLDFIQLFKKYIYISNIKKNILYCIIFLVAILYPFFTRMFMYGERAYAGSRYGYLLILFQSYFRYSGLLFLFAVIGFIYLVAKSRKNHEEWFILISFASFSPLLYMETYAKWFMPAYVFIFSGISLTNILKHVKTFAIILMLASILFSGYYQLIYFLNVNDRCISEKEYASGEWISSRIDGTLIGTSQYSTLNIFSISETPTLTISDMLNYLNGFIYYDETLVVQKYKMTSLNFYMKDPYEINIPSVEWSVSALSNWDVNGWKVEDLRKRYNISHFIFDDTSYSNLFTRSISVSSNHDKLYANGDISIWRMGVNPINFEGHHF